MKFFSGLSMNKFPVYIHMEKCGGMSLHHALRYALPGYECSGLIIPDTNLGGKITAREVFNEKTTPVVLD